MCKGGSRRVSGGGWVQRQGESARRKPAFFVSPSWKRGEKKTCLVLNSPPTFFSLAAVQVVARASKRARAFQVLKTGCGERHAPIAQTDGPTETAFGSLKEKRCAPFTRYTASSINYVLTKPCQNKACQNADCFLFVQKRLQLAAFEGCLNGG